VLPGRGTLTAVAVYRIRPAHQARRPPQPLAGTGTLTAVAVRYAIQATATTGDDGPIALVTWDANMSMAPPRYFPDRVTAQAAAQRLVEQGLVKAREFTIADVTVRPSRRALEGGAALDAEINRMRRQAKAGVAARLAAQQRAEAAERWMPAPTPTPNTR
jgi:hypothetical protein